MNLADFDRWLDERNLNGYWNRSATATDFGPYHWKWADIEEAVRIAAELVPMNDTGRRVIQMRHPDIGSRMSSTIHMAVQVVVPGEGITTVGDQRFEWADGDFFVIPPWSWHKHESVGADDAILFTMDDSPTFKSLGLYREEGDQA